MKKTCNAFCLFFVCFISISCGFSNKPKDVVEIEKVEEIEDVFIKGLKNSATYSMKGDDHNNGFIYNYDDGRKFKIHGLFYQIDFVFLVTDENENQVFLGLNSNVGRDEEEYFLPTNNYLISQYDFDGDDIDEIILSVQDTISVENGIGINIFKLIKDEWKRIGVMDAHLILGEPIAEIKVNKVKVNRNLRGFYYEWTYEGGKFVDTSKLDAD